MCFAGRYILTVNAPVLMPSILLTHVAAFVHRARLNGHMCS